MVTPPPVPDVIPDDEEIPDEDDPEFALPPPDEDDEPSVDRCGRAAVMCANLAPMTAAAATASTPTRQVTFLTRRRPSSLAVSAAFECLVGFTATGLPSNLCHRAEPLLAG